MSSLDFSGILFIGVLASGIICLINKIYWRKQRTTDKDPLLIEYARSFFSVLLIVFILRSFLYEPFRIPSGSMKPTLLIGDFILVNKYIYGIRLPVINKKIISIQEPRRGDVAVFRYPVNPTENFIKRIIGLPGDEITYTDKTLYINGKLIPKESLGIYSDADTAIPAMMEHYREQLGDVTHDIFQRHVPGRQLYTITVPPGHYFMMGDNRDDSDDSRYWGFVPETNLVGRAEYIWMSWNGVNHRIRFNRIGDSIE